MKNDVPAKKSKKTLNTPSNHLHYKGYYGSVVFSEIDAAFHGKIIGIKSLISFEGDTVAKPVADFRNAVDEYLMHCKRHGNEPEKPYKGSFNVRIGADLHRRAAVQANSLGMSLNSYVVEAIRKYVFEIRA